MNPEKIFMRQNLNPNKMTESKVPETAEEIFNKIPYLDKVGDYFNMPRSKILEAMKEYSSVQNSSLTSEIAKLKEEKEKRKNDAVDFGKWMRLYYGDINGLDMDILYTEYIDDLKS